MARSLQARLDAGEASNRAELAKLAGVSASRVTQILVLLRLAPDIQEHIEHERAAPLALAEPVLRTIATIADAEAQVEAFERAMEAAQARGRRAQGLRHLFERARRFRDLLDADPSLTQKAIGQREGISGVRVGQILDLLAQAPEIIARVDVPPADAPMGVGEQALRSIARIRDRAEQVAAFGKLVASDPRYRPLR